MFDNEYGDELERWKVELIVERARRMRFKRQDLADVQQEIVPQLLAFQFDPEKANGACEKTAFTEVIDRHLKTIRRAAIRYRNRVCCFSELSLHDPAWGDAGTGRSGSMRGHEQGHMQGQRGQVGGHLDVPAPDGCPRMSGLVSDVREGIAALCPCDQRICAELARGQTVAQIARRLGCGWYTVKRRIQRIRACFERIGMDGWVPRPGTETADD